MRGYFLAARLALLSPMVLLAIAASATAQEEPAAEPTAQPAPTPAVITPRWIGDVGYLRYLFTEHGKMAWGADYAPELTFVEVAVHRGHLKEDLKDLKPGFCADEAFSPSFKSPAHFESTQNILFRYSSESLSGGRMRITGKDKFGTRKQEFITTPKPNGTVAYERQLAIKPPKDFATRVMAALSAPPWKLRQEFTRLEANLAEGHTIIEDNGLEATDFTYKITVQYDSSNHITKGTLQTWTGERQLADRKLLLVWDQDKVKEEWTVGDDTAVIANYDGKGKVTAICDIAEVSD